nr:MAG TPA: GDSL-like Lipase/Acylhydrolase [Caudoviricetes sp.]
MNNIIIVKLDSTYAAVYSGIWQWNYGQILRIQGGNLPKVVEVHFSLQDKGGDSITRIGTTIDGATDVPIPDSFLENGGRAQDYKIYAFIYLEDGSAGNTEYKIEMSVKSRPKPEVPGTPEEPELFRETVKAVNAAADRAEQAEQNAKASATEAGKYAASASESAGAAEKTKEDALKEVGEKKQGAIEAIQKQEETSVGKIATHTDDEIQRIQNQTADSKAELEQTITNAGVSKEEIEHSIETAGTSKTALDKSTELAGTAKTELDMSTQKAGEAKTALDGSARTAGEMQETLSATVKQAGALDTSLGEKIETGTQLKTDLTASGEKAVQDIQTAGSEQLGKMQAVAEEFTADREQITTNKEDIGSLKEDLVDAMHYDSVEKIYKKLDVDFTNGTVGMLNSADTIDATKTDYIVSDYISLDGVRKIYRYGITNKYNLESYCLYDSNKNAIDNGFHARTTSYTFEEYEGRKDVVSYDISLTGAKYIRITKDTSISYYSFVIEKENGSVYTLKNDIHTPNIDENTEKITKIDSKVAMISDERLIAKSFIKFRSDRDIVYDNTYINTENGVVYNGDVYSSYKSSDYIPIDNTKKYNTAFCSRINFYDENRKWLYGQLAYGNKTGSGRMYKIEIQDERVAYARLTYAPSVNEPYCGLAEEQDNYEVLNLGDSIFGINPICFDISSIAQEKTGYKFANCGFGGSQASSYPDETSPFYSFNFWKIADAINSGDFSEQIASADEIYNGNASILYQNRIDILTSVDFSKLKLITIGYGTNDFSKAVGLDNENNRKDVTTYCGALRYGIEKLLAKYPHIQICLFSPPVKMLGSNNENISDTTPNNKGNYIKDFCNAMNSVADEYHLPYFNHHDNMGINDYNWRTFLRDGTHLTYDKGVDMFGSKVASETESLIN